MLDALLPKKWAHLADGADHVDVKTARGTMSVLEMGAGILSYRPAWMDFLWHVRSVLVRLLGLGKQGDFFKGSFTAETLPRNPGESIGFFTVLDSDGETYWLVEGRESHLEAVLCVFAAPVAGEPGLNELSVATVVRYRSRIGPVYFNLIRPFHHLVVLAAMRSVVGRQATPM